MSYLKKAIYRTKIGLRGLPLQHKILAIQENQAKPQSVMFYTVDKCASTFIPKLFDVILHDTPYQFIDYESAIESLGNKFTCEAPYHLNLKNFLETNSTNSPGLVDRLDAAFASCLLDQTL